MVVNITYMMAVCQKHLSFLIVFGQDRVIFKDSLSNVFNLVKQSHGTLFFKGSPHGGQVNVVGEEKKQSCKIIFLINYLAGQAFRRGEEKSVSDSSIWLHTQQIICMYWSCCLMSSYRQSPGRGPQGCSAPARLPGRCRRGRSTQWTRGLRRQPALRGLRKRARAHCKLAQGPRTYKFLFS